jgi:quercetin dioxygenase-like cupin family protein
LQAMIAPRSMRFIVRRLKRAHATTVGQDCGHSITPTTTARLCWTRTGTTSRRSVTSRCDAMNAFQIENTFVALDDACGAAPLAVSEGFWEKLSRGQFGSFSRMVSAYTFAEDWTMWEKHPAGEEFVCLLEGEVDFFLQQGNAESKITLTQPGAFVLVPADTWHTAKFRRPSKMLFITPGEGTEHKSV